MWGTQKSELLRSRLAFDADFGEVEDDAAAGHGTAEVQLRAEAREHEDFVELPARSNVAGPGENVVVDDLALLIEDGFDDKQSGVVGTADGGHGELGEAFEARGLRYGEGQIVCDRAERNASENSLHHEQKREHGGKDSAGSGNGQRLENILEKHASTRAPILTAQDYLLGLGGASADARDKIGRRHDGRDVGKGDAHAAIVIEDIAAGSANCQMGPNFGGFMGLDGAIQVAGEQVSCLATIHSSPPTSRGSGDVASLFAFGAMVEEAAMEAGAAEGISAA